MSVSPQMKETPSQIFKLHWLILKANPWICGFLFWVGHTPSKISGKLISLRKFQERIFRDILAYHGKRAGIQFLHGELLHESSDKVAEATNKFPLNNS